MASASFKASGSELAHATSASMGINVIALVRPGRRSLFALMAPDLMSSSIVVRDRLVTGHRVRGARKAHEYNALARRVCVAIVVLRDVPTKAGG